MFLERDDHEASVRYEGRQSKENESVAHHMNGNLRISECQPTNRRCLLPLAGIVVRRCLSFLV